MAARVLPSIVLRRLRDAIKRILSRRLCRQIGLDYLALDIFEARNVLCFDLNRASLSQELRESFDLVLNFGTTEHVFNQFNAFEVMHNARKHGGEMLHILAVAGHTDHGYFDYHGRFFFFFDLGGYNDYEIGYIRYITDGTTSHLLDSARSYALHFPALGAVTATGTIEGPQGPQPELPVLDVAVAVRYRKKQSARFLRSKSSTLNR
jgi:SAM-dependent methyltransferase